MRIKIKYTAQLKKAIGKREEFVEVKDGILMPDLLATLYQIYKQEFTDIVFSTKGDFMNAVLIVLNGQQVDSEYNEPLKENDSVTIMSPIAGG